MEILKVRNLCKTYGIGEAKTEALKNVSFSMEKGEFAAVIGESGSGKSTLLNCIGALDTPSSGTIRVDGQDLFGMKEEERTIFRRRNIGFIFQSFQLVAELNVEQNISFPLLLDYRKPEPGVIDEILELLGLTSRRRHLPGAGHKAEADSGRRAHGESGQPEQPGCDRPAYPGLPPLPADDSDDHPQSRPDRFGRPGDAGIGRHIDGSGRECQ